MAHERQPGELGAALVRGQTDPMNLRLRDNLESVRTNIADALRRSGRAPHSVRLVAVTKRRSLDHVLALHSLGVGEFGENYPQELWEKAVARPDLNWHLIGHLQGKKVARTAPLVRMIHGVDSLKLLNALDSHAATLPHPPEVLLQVNVSGEASKHGWSIDGLLADLPGIAACRSIPIVGLMTMAPLGTEGDAARPTFAGLRELSTQLAQRLQFPLPQLSMGMSGDYVEAVEEGATIVRVGSALFEGVDP